MEQIVTRVVEQPVERIVTRVVEQPVEQIVTRIVEQQVEKIVTRVVEQPVEKIVTRVMEQQVEKIVTRVVEQPVEKIVTRVVEQPVEETVTSTVEAVSTIESPTPEATPSATSTPVYARRNLAPLGSVTVSNERISARQAIDEDFETVWSSGIPPTQWIMVTLNDLYVVDKLELVVAQNPAGRTTHEVWLGEESGVRTLYNRFVNLHTEDGQTLDIVIQPPRVVNEVLVLTTDGPSWVAWREVRVFGRSPKADSQWFEISKAAEGLANPVRASHAGDGSGRMFVLEQKGRIRIFKDGVVLSEPFLDISDRVGCCGERGLLGIAFPPGYATKQHFYVNYTNTDGNTVVARYRVTADPNLADPDSEEIMLFVEQPGQVHNGGHLAFGPNDGYLYIATGDGGPPTWAQDPGSLLGKILRIDVESGESPYAIPTNNPFFDTAGHRGEIWAIGLRNPWTFKFDRLTGDLYIADVGGNLHEEINYQPASSAGGENYGWDILEGTYCSDPRECSAAGFIQPVVEYTHAQGCVVVGGTVYRGSQSARLQGIYLYADFCSGHVWGLKRDRDSWGSELLADVSFLLSSIDEDEDGNLYLTDHNHGIIWRVTDRSAVGTGAPTPTPVPAARPPSPRRNVALLGSATASKNELSAQMAIDDDLESLWNASDYAVQWLMITLDDLYLVDSVEMTVAQTPAGETSHEIWLGDASGSLVKYKEFVEVQTEDGQILALAVSPAKVIDRVLIRTVHSPSFVAWREVKVFGRPPPAATEGTATPETGDAQAEPWPEITLGGGLKFPVQITNAGDGSGRIFVVEQEGSIRIIKNGAMLSAPFLDISDRVECCWERGLFSIAFPPMYPSKNYLYLIYTNNTGDTVVSRFQVTDDPDIADPESEEILLTVSQPDQRQNGGHMAFGPNDGYLYIGLGDGGPPGNRDNRAQDPSTLLGKMLRIDVESGVKPYGIPPDNPYIDTQGDRKEIWALGLRNPRGFSFDNETGDLYFGDVGETQFEEINHQPASSTGGHNYGWRLMEGVHCYEPESCQSQVLTLPVAGYYHSLGCAVVGGLVYRGERFLRMQGLFVYADFCTGHIWGLRRTVDGWSNALLLDAPFQISAIGEDEEGNLYVADYDGNSIYRIVDLAGFEPEDPG